jgi:hypothetical protein
MCSLFSDEAVFVDFATLGDSDDSSDQIFPSHIWRHSLQADHGIDGFISGSCKPELANSVLHFLQCCSNNNVIAIQNSHSWWPTATLKCGLFPGWTKISLKHHQRIGRACWLCWLFLFDGRCCQPWCCEFKRTTMPIMWGPLVVRWFINPIIYI